jgi:hypothetical protein
MISWLWLLPAACLGVLLGSMLSVASGSDDTARIQRLREALEEIKDIANRHCNDSWMGQNDNVYLTAKQALQEDGE